MKYALALLMLMLSACTPNQQTEPDTVKIVEAIITSPDVVKLIRPSLPGRLPVKVALSPPHNAALDANTLGQRVISTKQTDPQALVLGISLDENEATVTMEYRPERVSGIVHLFKINGNWVVTTHSFWKAAV